MIATSTRSYPRVDAHDARRAGKPADDDARQLMLNTPGQCDAHLLLMLMNLQWCGATGLHGGHHEHHEHQLNQPASGPRQASSGEDGEHHQQELGKSKHQVTPASADSAMHESARKHQQHQQTGWPGTHAAMPSPRQHVPIISISWQSGGGQQAGMRHDERQGHKLAGKHHQGQLAKWRDARGLVQLTLPMLVSRDDDDDDDDDDALAGHHSASQLMLHSAGGYS